MSNHGLFGTQRARSPRLEPRPVLPQAVSVVTAPQLTASVNNYSPVGWDTCDVLRLSSSAAWNITGFRSTLDGRPRLLWNVGSFAIVLINASASSRVDNRISLIEDTTLAANSTCVIQYDVTSQRWRLIGQQLSASLNGFTGSQNVAAPNNVVNASRLLVVATSTNADFVLQPKGTGAILAQLPDSAIAGGNKRGVNAVDLQTKRGAAIQVASGNYSVVSGGYNNTASDVYSIVLGGLTNIASGVRSVVCGGNNNTASNAASVVSGGNTNTASGAYSVVSGGNANTASGTYSVVSSGNGNAASGHSSSVPGGQRATTRALIGMAAIASGQFATQGDAQRGQYILRGLTTDATAKVLTANQAAASTSNQVVLPNNSSYIVRGLINSHRTDVIGTSASWSFLGTIRRGANAAATVVVAAITATSIAQDAGAMMPSPWAVAITADTTNGCLKVQFTGAASTTIRTVCLVETVEVTS